MLGFNGGTLDLNGNNVAAGLLAGDTGFITDNAASPGVSTLTVDQAGTSTLGAGIINGATRTVAVTKLGVGALSLAGDNSFTGPLQISNGAVIGLGDGTRTPILSNVTLGDGSNDVFLIAGSAARQFGNSTVITFNNAGKNAKFLLRGSEQTVSGLESTADSSLSLAIIENDEVGSPGVGAVPGLATLTISAQTDHSFTGLIRNQVGGGMNLRKIGPATQEIRNALVQADAFATATVDEGTLAFNYIANGGQTNTFGAGTNFVVNAGGTLAFDGTVNVPATAGTISGEGTVVKRGTGILTLSNVNNFGSKGIHLERRNSSRSAVTRRSLRPRPQSLSMGETFGRRAPREKSRTR